MKLFIKNMVCRRCIMAVESVVKSAGYHMSSIELGEVVINEELDHNQLESINGQLKHLGFELIDDRKSRLVEKIKNLIIEIVHHRKDVPAVNLSAYLSDQLHYEYNYLSNLFTEVENKTIEKYFINQKIERVKELLIYDELTLAQIAGQLGYSSAAYLSSQFKKTTGFTPGYFKHIKAEKRRNIEEL